MSVLIQGGTVVNADRSFRADVLCEDGIITAVAEALEAPAGARVDARACRVRPPLPIIFAPTHTRSPSTRPDMSPRSASRP